MSQANVDLVRHGLERFAQDGLDAIVELADPRIELLTPANPDMQRGLGHDGLRQSLAGLLEMFEYWSVEPLEYHDLGDDVAVVVYQHARGKGSGVTVRSKSAWLFTLREGKAVRLSLLPDLESACAEAGELQSLRQ